VSCYYDANGEIIVENGVRNRIARFSVLVLLVGYNFDLPTVHHDGCGSADFAQDFVHRLAFVAATPSEASSQIVARAQRDDPHSRWVHKLNLV
jgi:hypothetical protein